MLKNTPTQFIAVTLGLLVANPTFAADARSNSLGGSAIANGYGVHGALENPSSLMRMSRQQQRFHMHLGVSVDIQDDAELIDTAIDEDTLIRDLEREIELLSGSTITCDITSTPETTCLNNTQQIGDLASTVVDILERADGESIKAAGAVDMGVAVTTFAVPVALHYRFAATGFSTTRVARGDLEYINSFANVLSDDRLTLNELIGSIPFSISVDGQTLNVTQPEDTLESDAQGGILLRSQIALSMARSFPIAGFNVDLGITPKFSNLTAAGIDTALRDQFDETTDTLSKQLENSEVAEDSFTFDIGATTELQTLPMRLSFVAKNLVEESITSTENIVFKTTPQLIVGGAYSIGSLTVSGDIALNEAKNDNLDTQIIALGLDYNRKYFGVRAGLSHDNARSADATALSLGLSLGPLHVGGRIMGRQSSQVAAQLAYSF